MKKLTGKFDKKKLIAIIVAVILAIIIIPSAVRCIVYKESPAQLISDIFTQDSKQILGKWQGDTAFTAFEFFDDGTYSSYISSFSYKGKYDIDGGKITLTNSSLSGSVVYKFSIHGNSLTMKAVEENGREPEDSETMKFTKVDKITMQSFEDLLDELTTENNEE